MVNTGLQRLHPRRTLHVLYLCQIKYLELLLRITALKFYTMSECFPVTEAIDGVPSELTIIRSSYVLRLRKDL